ncbi:MAG: PaaI family thioesterase [Hyphomonas sp.]
MPDHQLLREVFPVPARSSVSLGFELLELDAKAMTTRVRFNGDPEFTNPAGYIQGGYLVAMMDDAIGMLATVKAGTGRFPSTVDLHTHFLRPVRVGAIEVAARLRNIGRAMIFAQADLFDARGKEAARATASLTLNPVKAPATRS